LVAEWLEAVVDGLPDGYPPGAILLDHDRQSLETSRSFVVFPSDAVAVAVGHSQTLHSSRSNEALYENDPVLSSPAAKAHDPSFSSYVSLLKRSRSSEMIKDVRKEQVCLLLSFNRLFEKVNAFAVDNGQRV
jgi:hypothetical protein